MAKQNAKIEDYYRLRYVGQPDYCGAKNRLAYTRVYADQALDCYRSQIWIKELETGAEEKITAGGLYENYPRLSPDGDAVLFVSNVSGTAQIYVAHRQETADGISYQVDAAPKTHMRYDIHDPLWSPDGSRIAFLCDCEPDIQDELLMREMTAEEKTAYEEAKKTSPVVITDYGFKADEDKGFTEVRTTHLFVLDLKDDSVKKCSDGNRDHVMPIWSPDGRNILVTSNRVRPREESIGMDLFLVDTIEDTITQLSRENWIAYYPASFYPRYTPDGKTVVFGALYPDLSGNMPLTHLYRMEARPEAPEESIWPEKSPCHEATCFLYNGETMAKGYEKGQISEDGKYIYFISGWQGQVNLYRAAIQGTPEIVKLTEGHHYYSSMGEIQQGRMVLLKGDFTHTARIVLYDTKTGEETILVDPNPWLSEVALEEPEEMWMDTLDGTGRVHGWVLPPMNREPGKKYPAVLYIHGGPTPFYGYGMTWEHEALAGAGMAVIFCNPRGSSCYGSAHESNAAAFDGRAMNDLLQFVTEACSRYDFIDSERLGVTGGSYGGYMTNWITSHSKVFKAAVTQRSIANELIEYASADMAGSSQGFVNFEDFMVQEIEKSSVAYAEQIDIPFLILHALGDMRCPVEHAHQLFTAVKDTHPDLPVRMVLFPHGNHEMNNNGRMSHRMRHYTEMIRWFENYL